MRWPEAFTNITQSIMVAIIFFSISQCVQHAKAETPVVTYTGSARLIFERRCSQCHGPQWPDKDWTNYETAKKNAKLIRFRAFETKTMPPGNVTEMSTKEREMIREWVDGGAVK